MGGTESFLFYTDSGSTLQDKYFKVLNDQIEAFCHFFRKYEFFFAISY